MTQNSKPVVLREDSGPPAPGGFAGAEWRKAFLACLAFIFPFYRLSHFLLDVLPALVRVWVFGERLEFFRLSLFGGRAVAVPVSASVPLAPVASVPGRFGPPETAALVAVVLLALTFLRQRQTLLAGLTAATLGEAALEERWLRMAFGGECFWPCAYCITLLSGRCRAWLALDACRFPRPNLLGARGNAIHLFRSAAWSSEGCAGPCRHSLVSCPLASLGTCACLDCDTFGFIPAFAREISPTVAAELATRGNRAPDHHRAGASALLGRAGAQSSL